MWGLIGEEIEMAAINIPMELEHECWNCEGSGKSGNCKDDVCPFCDGVGYINSDLGQSLMDFLVRRGIAK